MNMELSAEARIDSLREALLQADAHASVSHEPGSSALRVRSRLDADQVNQVASKLGIDLAASFPLLDLRQLGSECCGGCSG